MKHMFKKFSAYVLTGLMALTLITPIQVNAAEDKTIAIYHTNDTHANVDNFPKVKSIIDADKNDAHFLFDAGDTLHGTSFAVLETGESITTLLNAVGYDAMTTGNHDYNYGVDRLLELAKLTDFPVLAYNVRKNGTQILGTTKIIEKNGIKIGVYGLATPETAYKADPRHVAGIDFGTEASIIADANAAAKSLEKAGADVIVCLSHLGIDESSDITVTDIFKVAKGTDLVIDGHSHSSLDAYSDFNEKAYDTKIASTGEKLDNLGKVEITLNADGTVGNINLSTIALDDTIEKNADIQKVIDDVNVAQKPLLDKVVGNTPIDLVGEREVVRYNHSNLGTLINDALVWKTGADMAFTNGGNIRASIPVGDITRGQILLVMPYGNILVTRKMSGAQIEVAVDNMLRVGAGLFMHFNGMDVEVTSTYKDGIKYYKAEEIIVDGKPLDLEKTYTIATNDFLVSGGDDFYDFKNATPDKEYGVLDEVVTEYVATLSKKDYDKYATGVNHLTIVGWEKTDAGQWIYGDYTRWVASGADWFFVEKGLMQTNEWVAQDATGNIWYYVGSDGAMVRNQTIDGYYVNSDGVWAR